MIRGVLEGERELLEFLTTLDRLLLTRLGDNSLVSTKHVPAGGCDGVGDGGSSGRHATNQTHAHVLDARVRCHQHFPVTRQTPARSERNIIQLQREISLLKRP